MNIARLPKANDRRSGFFKAVTGTSAGWQIPQLQGQESTFLQHHSPTVRGQRQVKNHHRKSHLKDLLWVDMITNALIVIVIALASYFFISATALRTNLEPAVTLYAEPSQSR
jgi:hypothetical protein